MRTRWPQIGFWALIAIGAVYAGWRGWNWSGYTDFDVYRSAGMRALDYLRGAKPAFTVSADETSPFRYAPIFSWFFAPFALLPENLSRSLWMFLQWGIYAYALQVAARTLRLSPTHRLAVLLGTLRFAVDNSNIGQVSALLTAWLVTAALRPGSWIGAGSHAAASLLKLQPLVLAMVPAWRRDARSLRRLGLMLLLLIVASAASLGGDAFWLWLKLASRAESVLDPSTIGNQSLYGAFVRILQSKDSARLAFVAILVPTALYAARCWRKSRWDATTGWALGLGYLPIFGVLTWKNTYLTWVLPLAFFVRSWPRLTWAVALALLLPSQGLLGSDLNGWALRVGLLPWTAWFAMMIYASRIPRSRESAQR